MKKARIGFAMCGSFCTHEAALGALNKLCDEFETVIVTRKNEKNVVIMSLEKYNNLRENLFLMQNRKNYQHILQGIEELEQGQTVTKVAEDLEEFLIE